MLILEEEMFLTHRLHRFLMETFPEALLVIFWKIVMHGFFHYRNFILNTWLLFFFCVENNARAANNDGIAAARDEDENQRDLLDWLYTLSRFVLVFSVVYFYSSFTRFLIVVVLTGLVVL